MCTHVYVHFQRASRGMHLHTCICVRSQMDACVPKCNFKRAWPSHNLNARCLAVT